MGRPAEQWGGPPSVGRPAEQWGDPPSVGNMAEWVGPPSMGRPSESGVPLSVKREGPPSIIEGACLSLRGISIAKDGIG